MSFFRYTLKGQNISCVNYSTDLNQPDALKTFDDSKAFCLKWPRLGKIEKKSVAKIFTRNIMKI